jgi:hypothetical protein
MAKLIYLLRELMIGCESEPLSLKSEYALICSIVLIRLTVVKLNASRKSKGELILKPEQEIAVKDLLLGKNVLAVLPTGYEESLIFTYCSCCLLARENITRINTDGYGYIVFLATGLAGLLRLSLL